ncbi:hypothetical protein FNV43_RR10505 [Rhamnella rubrinervis]|uniref:Uncharacterized protein n=1 Tax=Rhamnella rubrinervis TaxID=2594499 RepID=A0A8K0H467_9ROSA|nr:hypothetical protein FNV43_RR10505 [Rhamnella rubrinervis]
MVFDRRRHGEKLLAKTTAAPFEQRGGTDNRTVAVRIDGVMMDVEDYEQHNYCRYGVSYMVIKLKGFARMKDRRRRKRTSNMRALCGVMKVRFSLNQTIAAALPD